MPRKKSKGGAPSKLTAEVKAKILQALRATLPYSHAASLAEIDGSTLSLWKKKGAEEPTSEYGRFSREMRLARAAGLARLGLTVFTHAAGQKDGKGNVILLPDPKLALELLERRDPNNWGKRHTVSGPKGGAVPFQSVESDDETQRLLVEKLKKLELTTKALVASGHK